VSGPKASRRRTDASPPAGTDLAAVHAAIAEYYTAKVRKFGATPLGVDWTCVPTQEMRFVQLLKLCDFTAPFSLNDVGCGYGALLSYLDWRHGDCAVDYLGLDLSQAMLRQARRLWRNRPNVAFALGGASPRVADYSVASGIFNVQQDQPLDLWETFVATTLDHLHRTSSRGFAVNFMRRSSPQGKTREGLYCTEPERWTNYCAAEFGARSEIIEDYGLREFTLIVRR
jgi:SAM-dependent methyltransferase